MTVTKFPISHQSPKRQLSEYLENLPNEDLEFALVVKVDDEWTTTHLVDRPDTLNVAGSLLSNEALTLIIGEYDD